MNKIDFEKENLREKKNQINPNKLFSCGKKCLSSSKFEIHQIKEEHEKIKINDNERQNNTNCIHPVEKISRLNSINSLLSTDSNSNYSNMTGKSTDQTNDQTNSQTNNDNNSFDSSLKSTTSSDNNKEKDKDFEFEHNNSIKISSKYFASPRWKFKSKQKLAKAYEKHNSEGLSKEDCDEMRENDEKSRENCKKSGFMTKDEIFAQEGRKKIEDS